MSSASSISSISASSSSSTSTSTDWWCGGIGQVKWLTDVVAGGKSNDWLMQWYGNSLCLALVLALSLALALALALEIELVLVLDIERYHITASVNHGQVKWLTDVVAGGKSNDWLMQWYHNALCLALALSLVLAPALALTDDVVAVGKSNDWLMWWQGASQMIHAVIR